MPVEARKFIRKMRGGAQAHLLECADGGFYVVKFRNNPQHRRILLNELLAAQILQQLEISTPSTALIHLSAEFLSGNPEVHLQMGHSRIPVEPGWHFGSRYPGDPGRISVYDFMPDSLLQKVENLQEFAGILVFDKWAANADSRQAVYLRARIRELVKAAAVHPLRTGFVALFIDHGYILNGPHWEFPDSPLSGVYFRPLVYRSIRGWHDFEPWLERVRNFPEHAIDRAFKQIPPDWLEEDEEPLTAALEKLLARRKRVAALIEQSSARGVDPFPNWKR